MASPYEGLAEQTFASLISDPYEGITPEVTPELPDRGTALTMQEAYESGLDSGISGMQAGVESFKALLGTFGDSDQYVADKIESASYYEQDAAKALEGMQPFEEFYDNPTFSGFLMQASSALGQAAPSIATTVGGALATGGTSVIAQVAGKGAMAGVNKFAARRVIKEAVENVANDVASPDEKTLIDTLYTTFKRGAAAGAGVASFVPQAGQNFSEGLEAGRDPDTDLALRSLAVAAPQAALDVGAQALILKSFVNVAKAKPATDGSILGNLAKTIAKGTAKGAATEGLTEATQEGISVLNRIDMDSSYTTQEAQLRIAQGAFMGLVSGGVMGGGSSTLGGGIQAGRQVMDKAKEYLQQGQEQQADAAMNRESYGTQDGYTTPESNADVSAQLNAMFDPAYGKTATWVAGEADEATRASMPEDNKVYQVDIGGKRAFAAHIPGRGTIYGRKETVQAIVAEGASDESLQIALGYSAVKQGNEDIVVQVQDANGNVVWEEATTADGKAAALVAAGGIAKDAGTIRTVSLKDALAERKAKYEAERGPTVNPVQEEGEPQPEVQQEQSAPEIPQELQTSYDWVSQQEGSFRISGLQRAMRQGFNKTVEQLAELEKRGLVRQNEDATYEFVGPRIRKLDEESPTQGEFEPEVIETQQFEPRNTSRDDEGGFENTAEVRQAFTEAFQDEMDVDFDLPFYSNMSESFMKRAVALKNQNPTEFVSIRVNPDLTYKLDLQSTPETENIRIVDYRTRQTEEVDVAGESVEMPAIERNVPISKFLRDTIQQARKSKFADQGAVLVTPEGESIPVNMSDLTNAGKRLAESRDRGDFQQGGPTQAALRGLTAMLSELAARGYDVQINGASALQNQNALRRSNIVVDTTGGNEITARSLFVKGRAETRPSPRRRETDTKPPFSNENEFYAGFEIRDDQGQTLETLDTFEEAKQARDRIRNELPQDQKDANLEIVPLENRSFIERGTESGLGGETEVMAEQSVRGEDPGDMVPLTRLNLQDDPQYQSRRRGDTRPKKQSTFREATFPFGLSDTTKVTDTNKEGKAVDTDENIAISVINRAINSLRLGRPVSVIGLKGLQGRTVAEIRSMFGDEQVANTIIQQLGELRDNPNARGRYVGFRDTHMILIDDRAGNPLEHSLAAAHELGHALFEEERATTLANKALRSRLQKAFEKAKAADDAPQAYEGELGFEEWYADQVAVWAQKLYKKQKAKNMVEGHFKQLAEKLRRMWQAISSDLRRRFSNYTPEFDSYMDAVVSSARRNRQAAYQRSAARETTFEQLSIIRQLDEARAARNPRELAQRMIGKIRAFVDSRDARSFTRNILAADNILSGISRPIARMFYGKSQDGAELGFVPQTTVTLNKWVNRLEDAIGTNWDSLDSAFKQAASDTPTSELSGPALAIREYLEDIYDELIVPSALEIDRQENYFPVALDLAKIYEDIDSFVADLIKAQPELSQEQAENLVQGIINRQEYIMEGKPIKVGDPDPAGHMEAKRVLTAAMNKKDLRKYSLPPQQAMTQYIRHVVKRVEFAKATRDEKGKDKLGPELRSLNPEDRAEAVNIINTYLGYNSKPLNPAFRKVSSWAQFIQMATLLPLATLSSFPELAGAIVNTKEFGGVTMAMKEMVNTINSRQESMELARSIGVSASSTMQNIFSSEAEAEFLDPTVRDLSDKFFYYTGLDFFTRFTREFSANMGVAFILNHAHNKSGNPRSTRYLEDLGLTANEVKAWERSGRKFDTETGRKVEQGLQRFVEASALRPNAAERPIWASDPHMAIVWQLKGYFYSFGKVILGGLRREASKRIDEADGNALAAMSGIGTMMLLTGVAYLPLAMLSLELREYAKYGIAYVLPGVDADAKRYFKSDQMDWPAYLNESFDRSGLMGPLALLTMAGQQADWGQSGVASLLGPTVEMFEDIASDGWDVVPNRLLPVYSMVY